MKHVRTISRKPQFAQQTPNDLTFILALLNLAGTLFGTVTQSFLLVFDGILSAVGDYNGLKNPAT